MSKKKKKNKKERYTLVIVDTRTAPVLYVVG